MCSPIRNLLTVISVILFTIATGCKKQTKASQPDPAPAPAAEQAEQVEQAEPAALFVIGDIDVSAGVDQPEFNLGIFAKSTTVNPRADARNIRAQPAGGSNSHQTSADSSSSGSSGSSAISSGISTDRSSISSIASADSSKKVRSKRFGSQFRERIQQAIYVRDSNSSGWGTGLVESSQPIRATKIHRSYDPKTKKTRRLNSAEGNYIRSFEDIHVTGNERPLVIITKASLQKMVSPEIFKNLTAKTGRSIFGKAKTSVKTFANSRGVLFRVVEPSKVGLKRKDWGFSSSKSLVFEAANMSIDANTVAALMDRPGGLMFDREIGASAGQMKAWKRAQSDFTNPNYVTDIFEHPESRVLGAGNFGEVRHIKRGDGVEYACKKMKFKSVYNMPDGSQRTVYKKDVISEVTNVVFGTCAGCQQYFGAIVIGDYIYLAQELKKGGDVEKAIEARLKDGRPAISLTESAEIIGQMNALNKSGIKHLDLKPSNVLLSSASPEGGSRVAVADFGKAVRQKEKNIAREYFGSNKYLPPEWVLGGEYDLGPDAKTTVWSTGMTILHSLEPAIWKRHKDMSPFMSIMKADAYEAELKEVLSSASNIPAPQRKILASMLAFNPSQRPSIEQAHGMWQASLEP